MWTWLEECSRAGGGARFSRMQWRTARVLQMAKAGIRADSSVMVDCGNILQEANGCVCSFCVWTCCVIMTVKFLDRAEVFFQLALRQTMRTRCSGRIGGARR
jgi:hypothetical protein